MGPGIQTRPCMEMRYSLTRYFHPWRGYLGRDRGMILCLNQDERGFSIPQRWGRYMSMIQDERKMALIMRHDASMDVRGEILSRRDLPIRRDNYPTSKSPGYERHNGKYLVMKWDEDMVLINPKRVPSRGTFQYRSSATKLPHDKITRLGLVIGELGLTRWAYKWLDIHISSMKSLEEVIFIDSGALSYLQNVIVDLTSGEPSEETVDDWEDRSCSADLLKTYTLRPAFQRLPEALLGQGDVPQEDAILTSTQDAALNWGWVPAGPDGMSLIEMPEYSKMLCTIRQRGKPIVIGYMVHAVPQETARILGLIKWLDSI
ncbi:hypothetical protein F4775DRAFT_547409 [Biscogniauxia sp. FL1348]|nr:hypothetical protein F4775DRAFT_547409 [Biscogniauxia sp. FL1348]